MTEDIANTILQSLINHGMISTKFNMRSQEQEFFITDFGMEVYMVLRFFMEKKGDVSEEKKKGDVSEEKWFVESKDE